MKKLIILIFINVIYTTIFAQDIDTTYKSIGLLTNNRFNDVGLFYKSTTNRFNYKINIMSINKSVKKIYLISENNTLQGNTNGVHLGASMSFSLKKDLGNKYPSFVIGSFYRYELGNNFIHGGQFSTIYYDFRKHILSGLIGLNYCILKNRTIFEITSTLDINYFSENRYSRVEVSYENNESTINKTFDINYSDRFITPYIELSLGYILK